MGAVEKTLCMFFYQPKMFGKNEIRLPDWWGKHNFFSFSKTLGLTVSLMGLCFEVIEADISSASYVGTS